MKKVKRFKSSITAIPDVGEINTKESMTVPNMAMSVDEILRRFASGTLGNVYSEPDYSEDMPDLRGLDYVERHNMVRENKENIGRLRSELNTPKYKVDPDVDVDVDVEKVKHKNN